ncbi:glucose-methanol-choline oxidoreductase-like protein [Dendryphion nanum]|uniref:Glucose-methanol-choline oxidoreductase-like protein n=1 Tax=Dendryphion nanum TaxID=256645 RepID=A0A9P9IVX4_9PLEO|nr:glucose-methanol-choline oxidoreductase-like protein [Dendryphion nanum]
MSASNSYSYVETLLGGIRRFPPAPTSDTPAFDFIIIGGGTAGLVLANRLTQREDISVLVLEAGENLTSHPRVKIPALYATLLGSDADWALVTEPQEGLKNRTLKIWQGRALGGSSAINTGIFVPTSRSNLDTWSELGNSGWDWRTLLPYFKKSHTLVPPTDPAVLEHLHIDDIDAVTIGTDGPIQVSYVNEAEDPLPNVWVETLEKLGHAPTGDLASGNLQGVFTNPNSIDASTRERSYATSAYLQPIEARPNLTVITGAFVQKIILSGSTPTVTATGVQYQKSSETLTATAKREVILSAGALHSPKILELSGIGNPTTLSEFNIETVIPNPNVGENLQDHPMAGFSFEVREGVDTMDDLYRQDPTKLQEVMRAYATERKGPLTQSAHSSALLALPSEPEPSAWFHAYAAQGNFTDEPLDASALLAGNFYTIIVSLLHPLSRGSVHISNSDSSAPAKINPQYLSHSQDLETFAKHMAFIARIITSSPMKFLIKPRGRRNAGAPKDLADLEAMKEYLRDTIQSSGHPVGTCAMLPRESRGVVDERLKVYGTKNLRVVDASVFPVATRGNPIATVYAVAERAADIVKEDLGLAKEGDD